MVLLTLERFWDGGEDAGREPGHRADAVAEGTSLEAEAHEHGGELAADEVCGWGI